MAAITAGAIAAGAATAGGNLASSIYSTERNMEAAGLNPAAIGASMGAASTPSSAAALGNYGHGSDFSNIFSSAVSAALAKDKNMANKVLQEMKDESALQVQRLRNEGRFQNEVQKKELGHLSYGKKRYDDDFASNILKEKVQWREL